MQEITMVNTGLIPVYTSKENEQGLKIVDARDLHAYLEVGKKYTTWLLDKFNKYGFEEGIDFFPILGESNGGRPSTEYYLSIETAKEIAMVQNNEKGKEVRKYFIGIEKEYMKKITKEIDEVRYLDMIAINTESDMRVAIARMRTLTEAYSFSETDAAIMVHQAKMDQSDFEITLHEILCKRKTKETLKKRNRIFVRINALGKILEKLYPTKKENPYAYAWKLMNQELYNEIGITKRLEVRHEEDKIKTDLFNNKRPKGVNKKPTPTYLDYIEELECHREAETIVDRLIETYQAELDTVYQDRLDSNKA